MLWLTRRSMEPLERSTNTITARIAGLEYNFGPRRTRKYNLADVLPRLKRSELNHLPSLFASAEDDGHDNAIGDGAVRRVELLERWFTPVMHERAKYVRDHFARNLHGVPSDRIDQLVFLSILHAPSLELICCGGTFPHRRDWIDAFVVANGAWDPAFERLTTQKEAA